MALVNIDQHPDTQIPLRDPSQPGDNAPGVLGDDVIALRKQNKTLIEKVNTLIVALALGGYITSTGTTATSSPSTSTGTGTTTTTGGTATVARTTIINGQTVKLGYVTVTLPDMSLGRIDESIMSTVNVPDAAALTTQCAANLTNVRLVLTAGATYQNFFNQTGTWTNVLLVGGTGSGTKANIANDAGGCCMFMQGQNNPNRTRVAIRNIAFSSTYSGTQYTSPLLTWNEKIAMDGFELSGCSFTCPNAYINAFGCTQYSRTSNQGVSSKNIWIKNNSFSGIGRCAIEMTSQGYDNVFRVQNLQVENNVFANCGLKGEYGMFISVSGLFKTVAYLNNSGTNSSRMAYEMVNAQQCFADNNSVDNMASTSTTSGVGWGISDDDQGYTKEIIIRGGSIKVKERPFYVYDSKSIAIDAQNVQWYGRRGLDMHKSDACYFSQLNVLIQTPTSITETSWQWDNLTTNCICVDSTISSAGAAAAGFNPAFETIVLRSGATNNTFDNVKTILGKKSDNTTFAATNSGGNGAIVNNGGATNNIMANCTYTVVA